MTNVIWQMETERRGHLKGYLFAAAAAVLWGFSGCITKYLLRRQMRPDELLVFRTLLASAILMVWLGLKSPQLLKVRRADLLSLILLGVVGLVLNQGFYYLSLTMVSVGCSLLLQYLAPVHLMIYGVLSKTERVTGGKMAAAFTAICGCALMVLGQEGGIARISPAGVMCAIPPSCPRTIRAQPQIAVKAAAILPPVTRSVFDNTP